MSDAQSDPYAALVEIAERKLELVGRGEVDDASSLAERWSELTGSLPEQPPPSALPLLERAALVNDRTHVELLLLREALLCDLRTTAQASRAARGYARQTFRPRGLDHSA